MSLTLDHYFPFGTVTPALARAYTELKANPLFDQLSSARQIEAIEASEARWQYWINETGSK